MNNIKHADYDVYQIRQDFPILKRSIRGKLLAYLDNAASTQKPKCVINAISDFYSNDYANIRRSAHFLSDFAEMKCNETRETIKNFICAEKIEEIIFTSGTTESINMVVFGYCYHYLQDGDTILLTVAEHHANIVPWQLLQKIKDIKLEILPIEENGEISLESFKSVLFNTNKLKFISITHMSNVLGHLNSIKDCIKLAKKLNIPIMIDGAQAIAHGFVNVKDLGCDFYVFSAHKIYGPTGIGVLYGKIDALDKIIPNKGGGSMIKKVSFKETLYADLPHRLESGTPNIAGIIGFGVAIKYFNSIINDSDGAFLHEKFLIDYLASKLQDIFGKSIRILGEISKKHSLLSCVFDFAHPHDLSTVLDSFGVATRSGHHCAMPLAEFYGVNASLRISVAFYNSIEEIDRCIAAILEAKKLFNK